MSTENRQTDVSAKVNNAISKLNNSTVLSFDDDNKASPGKDINGKITALDSDLVQLRTELSAINSSVEEGLDRLGDTDTDLTAKVSETYKRLGEIDNSYKALLEISSRIDNDMQRLNGDISDVAEQSATGIKSLEQSTFSQSNDLVHKNQQVVSRVNHLAETSKLTSEMMQQNVQSVTEKMLLIEKNVVTQIENLSSTTKDKTDVIENTVEINKAKILKLQSVDEAIIRRATTLEITAAELTAKGQYLDSSVEQLQISSDALSNNLKELSDRTKVLESLTSQQGSMIDGLQKAGVDIAAKLVTLSGREKNHFNLTLVALLLLVVISVGAYLSQKNQFADNDLRSVERSEMLQQKIGDLQQAQAGSVEAAGGSLAYLESRIQLVADKLSNVQDQTESMAAQINQSPLFDQIGDDNIIHGPQWIASLPAEGFTLQLANADNKEILYEIAQDYNFYLKDTLSYFVTDEKGAERYVLLSGSYANRQLAVSAVQSLPGYIGMQRPVVREISAVQKYIAEL